MSAAPRGGRDLDHTVARLLTIGTYISVALLALGVVLMVSAGRSPLDSTFPAFDLKRLPSDLVALRPEGFLWLGLIAVLATPSSRVLASLFGYLEVGDRRMAVVSIAILTVIGASIAIGALSGGSGS